MITTIEQLKEQLVALPADEWTIEDIKSGRFKEPVVLTNPEWEEDATVILLPRWDSCDVKVWREGRGFIQYVPVLRSEKDAVSIYRASSIVRIEADQVRLFKVKPVNQEIRDRDDSYRSLVEAINRRTDKADQIQADMTERLHEIANLQGWCSEFDEVMKNIGLPTRECDMEAEVECDFKLEIESPSSQLDVALSEEFEFSMVALDMQVSAQATINMRYRGRPDESPEFSHSEVEDEIRSIYGLSVDLSDFSIESYNQV